MANINVPEVQITNDPFAAVRIPEYRNLMIGRFTFCDGYADDYNSGGLVDLSAH